MKWMKCTWQFIPDSLFAEEEGVSCGGCLPAWALVEYVSSVESREAMGTNDKGSSPVEIKQVAAAAALCSSYPGE